MKKKRKKAMIIILITALIIAVGSGVWYSVVRIESKKYNLISLDTSSLPEPIAAPDEETDIELNLLGTAIHTGIILFLQTSTAKDFILVVRTFHRLPYIKVVEVAIVS